MKNIKHLAIALVLSGLNLGAGAETPEEAKALLEAAVAAVKAKGVDGAVTEFNAGGKWTKGALYVVAVKFDGSMVAHSSNGKMVGKNMLEAKDAAGKAFVQETIAQVKAKGQGQVEMRWANPATKQIGDAVMYSRAVPGQDMYVGSVVFK